MPRHVFTLALAVLLGACASTSSHDSAASPEWLRPSPLLHQQIEDQVSRLPWTHGVERVQQIQWFADVGEPAYGRLLELCVDERPDVAASAVAALGATHDSRLVTPMRALRWPESDDRALRFEKARTFVRLGDWSDIGVLIAGLEDDSAWARAWCSQALREATAQDFGYDPRGDAGARAEAVAKWKVWQAAREGEGILTHEKGSSSPRD